MAIVIYIKAEQRTEVREEKVTIKDIATVYCRDNAVMAKVKTLSVCQMGHEKMTQGSAGTTGTTGNARKKIRSADRKVVSMLYVIQLIERKFPNASVENLGETEIIVALEKARRFTRLSMGLKLVLIACISFFGTMLTIMAYHNDIGIHDVFAKLYEQVMGQPSPGYTILEISYSIGLGTGIIIFFNHVGKKRITRDATPIEVEMRTYETDVNKALIETAEREGQTIEPS